MPVGYCRYCNEDVGLAGVLHDGSMHLASAFDIDTLYAPRTRQGSRAGYQGNGGTRFAGRLRQCVTGFAGRTVADDPHRVDTFGRWAGGDQDMPTGQHFGLEKGDQFGQQLVGFKHAAIAGFAAGLVAAAGAQNNDAVIGQLADIALGGRVFPHFAIHGRRYQKRAGPTGQAKRSQQIVGQPMDQFCNQVGTGGRDQDGIGTTGQVDVGHAVRNARVPRAGID